MKESYPSQNILPHSFLQGGGEMGALMRSIDWSSTPLGPAESWPQSLRTAVSICLASRFPMLIWWGPELVMLYNDAYRPMLGDKHPAAMGQRGRDCWPEIWHIIGPMLQGVLERGEATWSDDQLLLLDRNGYLEECYFTFSYSPIREETGGVGGAFTAVTETTERVLGERRLATLRELAARAAETDTAEEACRGAAGVLADNPADLPFALIYLVDDERNAHLAGSSGLPPGTLASPPRVQLDGPDLSSPWPLAAVFHDRQPAVVGNLPARFGVLPGGLWPTSPETALVLPMTRSGQEELAGLLVVGLSPRRALDESYRGFCQLVAGHIATGIANARAYEEERRRAEALAEIDRAKTAFFSNVSHEFRTPLTLILGPLEELAARPDLPPGGRESLELVHHNALRLLKLVNTLLDFSRIEAGRTDACYEPTDLAAATADLASAFRSAVEAAGLRLTVDCPPLPEPVYVDRDMWEKVVLNLVSNAFKFTFEGEIRVALRQDGTQVELTVADTGTGIPGEELPRVFDRFHRVHGARSRTHEGTGIGLSLVHDLVALHGGTVQVESELDRGSAFTVTLPAGSAHLPAERVRAPRSRSSTALGHAPFVEEAGRWMVTPSASPPAGPVEGTPHILLADDNADMRDYARRLLEQAGWSVEAVADGQAALEAARSRAPDLVLTDVMMPRLDGFELLRRLREDLRTRTVPVILISARAGEESWAEGLEAGADDYLIKPFSARELIARVGAHLKMGTVRQEAMRREQTARAEADTANQAKDRFLAVLSHELRTPLTPVLAVVSSLEPDPRLPSDIRQQLATARRNLELEARLIDDLLDLTRITRGVLGVERGPTDLRVLLEHALRTCCPAKEGHYKVITDFAARDHRVLGDGPRLTQVFWNLLRNAVKFTPQGGTIAVRTRTQGDAERWVVVEISDTGIGIRPEFLPHVFDAFHQDRENGRAEGLGLGLTISRAIIEIHGGRIAAASAGPNRGATFTVALPEWVPASLGAEPGQRFAAGEGRSPEARERPLSILLVEDHTDTAEVMADLLESWGHRVEVASTLAEARAAAFANPEIDLVLSDLGLPDGSGLDLMRELTERLALPGIALSGYGMEEDVRQSRAAGFRRHLTKPVTVEALQAAIREAALGMAKP